jgi:hypothetical protein
MKACVAALVLLLVATACGDDAGGASAPDASVGAGMMAPYFGDIEQLADEATLVLHGQVGAEREVFSVEGSATAPMYGYRVYEMVVTDVIASAALDGDHEVSAGDTVLVGVFAQIDEMTAGAPSAIGTVGKFAHPLEVGDDLVIFAAPFAFRDDVTGYAISGGDFGVFDVDAEGLLARAPEGPLVGTTRTIEDLRAQLAAAGNVGDAIAARRAEQGGTPPQIEGSVTPTTRG